MAHKNNYDGSTPRGGAHLGGYRVVRSQRAIQSDNKPRNPGGAGGPARIITRPRSSSGDSWLRCRLKKAADGGASMMFGCLTRASRRRLLYYPEQWARDASRWRG